MRSDRRAGVGWGARGRGGGVILYLVTRRLQSCSAGYGTSETVCCVPCSGSTSARIHLAPHLLPVTSSFVSYGPTCIGHMDVRGLSAGHLEAVLSL